MLPGSLWAALPIIIAGIGGLYSQRAGVLNIALEGLILAGAFTAVLTGMLTGSFAAAAVSGAVVGLLLVQLQAYLALRLQANVFIVGLGMNLLISGSIPVISHAVIGTAGVFRLPAGFPGGEWAVPVGAAVAGIAVIGSTWIFGNTRFGIELNCAGSTPELLKRRGLSPVRYRAAALSISGICAGLAGAILSLRIGAYAPGMSAGRGWIALGAVFLGFQYPAGVVAGALIYGITDAVAGNLQEASSIPSGLLMTLPYIVAAAAFILSSAVLRRQNRG
ncbi:MAG: ABC transporter permease [Spirochaeta sp.]